MKRTKKNNKTAVALPSVTARAKTFTDDQYKLMESKLGFVPIGSGANTPPTH